MVIWTDQPSVRPTFLSEKVGKTISIRKTCFIKFTDYFLAETLSFERLSGCEWVAVYQIFIKFNNLNREGILHAFK